MSGSELIASFGKVYPVMRFASSTQQKTISFDAPLITGNVITLLVDGVEVGPVPFNATNEQTLADLADEIADIATIASATAMFGDTILITALDAGNEILIFEILVSGGATQANAMLDANGGYIDGDFQDGDTTTFEAVISLQPITGQELLLLSEGNRNRRYLRGYTSTRLYTENEATASNADRIYYDNALFEVQQVEKWTPMDLNHYSILFAEMNNEHGEMALAPVSIMLP